MNNITRYVFVFVVGSISIPLFAFLCYLVAGFVTWNWVILGYFKENLNIYLRFGIVFGLTLTIVGIIGGK